MSKESVLHLSWTSYGLLTSFEWRRTVSPFLRMLRTYTQSVSKTFRDIHLFDSDGVVDTVYSQDHEYLTRLLELRKRWRMIEPLSTRSLVCYPFAF